MRAAIINGSLVPPDQAVISVYDRGFLYGDSVFETIRTYGGVPFAEDEHLTRLAGSLERVGIPLPVTLETLASDIAVGLREAKNPESYIRVMVTRGAGPMGLDPDLAERPSRVVLVEPLVPPARSSYEHGIAAIFVRTTRATDATAAAGAKVANYLTSLLAIREAKRAGAAEALIVDGHGSVLEGASSNLFIVRGGELLTPPEDAGILPGITRAHLLDAASSLGVAVRFLALTEGDVLGANEAFISSSIREVLPVVRIGATPIGDGRPGAVTRRLHAEFRRRAGAFGPNPWALV
jgi:branched-chain amino acid aminotransferase